MLMSLLFSKMDIAPLISKTLETLISNRLRKTFQLISSPKLFWKMMVHMMLCFTKQFPKIMFQPHNWVLSIECQCTKLLSMTTFPRIQWPPLQLQSGLLFSTHLQSNIQTTFSGAQMVQHSNTTTTLTKSWASPTPSAQCQIWPNSTFCQSKASQSTFKTLVSIEFIGFHLLKLL